jgi:phosphinothricin acetyltransferase
MIDTIRLATAADAAQVQAIYAPVVRDTPISFEAEPPGVDEMRRRIVTNLEHERPWLVAELDGMVAGYVYASQHRERAAYRWCADVSVYVHESARRRSVGRALYTSLFAVLALQGFHNLYAGATLPNPASVALHESLGFRPVGVYHSTGYKLGAWHDVIWWERELGARPVDPLPTLSLDAAQQHPDWAAALAAGILLIRPGTLHR